MKPIRIIWTRTEDDYVRAVLLHQASLKGFRLASRVLFPLTAALLAIYWIVFGQDTLIVAFTAAFLVLLTLLLGVRWFGLPRHARRVFRQQASLSRPLTLELDDEGIRARSGEEDQSFLRWEECHRWVEGRSEFLIYPSDAIFYMLPKAMLGDDAAELRQVLEQRVGLAKGRVFE